MVETTVKPEEKSKKVQRDPHMQTVTLDGSYTETYTPDWLSRISKGRLGKTKTEIQKQSPDEVLAGLQAEQDGYKALIAQAKPRIDRAYELAHHVVEAYEKHINYETESYNRGSHSGTKTYPHNYKVMLAENKAVYKQLNEFESAFKALAQLAAATNLVLTGAEPAPRLKNDLKAMPERIKGLEQALAVLSGLHTEQLPYDLQGQMETLRQANDQVREQVVPYFTEKAETLRALVAYADHGSWEKRRFVAAEVERRKQEKTPEPQR